MASERKAYRRDPRNDGRDRAVVLHHLEAWEADQRRLGARPKREDPRLTQAARIRRADKLLSALATTEPEETPNG